MIWKYERRFGRLFASLQKTPFYIFKKSISKIPDSIFVANPSPILDIKAALVGSPAPKLLLSPAYLKHTQQVVLFLEGLNKGLCISTLYYEPCNFHLFYIMNV